MLFANLIGPVPQEELFDDLDEQGEQLLSSLHLGPAEEEPVRRGAASRANSVRFDESALHGSSWAGHNSRHSGDFAPIRPGSGLMMERSLSHKSDGRHSSAVSVHSHHSVASGRASSLGLDTNFAVGDDDSSLDIPEPPASFYVLGSVPSIVRCWLTTQYAHGTLLYADICTGSQKSTVHHSLLGELDLLEGVERDADGVYRIRLNVYLSEATVIQHSSRSASPGRAVPSMAVLFEVIGIEGKSFPAEKTLIRIFIGSDALRAHAADILFSRNTMVLYGEDRSRLRVPFVRPEDDSIFRHICTTSIVPEKPKLNVNAAPFVFGEPSLQNNEEPHSRPSSSGHCEENRSGGATSSPAPESESQKKTASASVSESGGESERLSRQRKGTESSVKDSSVTSDASRRQSSNGIWGSWRLGGSNNADGSGRENGPLSGYQPAARGGRSMKVLKPQKAVSSCTRTGTSYEPPTPSSSKFGGEGRRKSLAGATGDQGFSGANRWDVGKQRTVSAGTEAKYSPQNPGRDIGKEQTLPTRTNPVGGASAFSWMTPPVKSKTST